MMKAAASASRPAGPPALTAGHPGDNKTAHTTAAPGTDTRPAHAGSTTAISETMATTEEATSGQRPGAGSVLTPAYRARRLPGETARRSTITQIYEGTNQIQRVVMARQLLK
jgi:hypothetical protein